MKMIDLTKMSLVETRCYRRIAGALLLTLIPNCKLTVI